MPKIKLPLRKIISGGQTGADIAGLKAAKELGLETGGWMPKGFRTLEGARPEYRELYGLRDTESSYYPPRTALNVKESDGTVRFATDWESPGEKLTLKLINQYKKPAHGISLTVGIELEEEVKVFRAWLVRSNIQTLNVAGNSEQTSPGIEEFVFNFLVSALRGYV